MGVHRNSLSTIAALYTNPADQRAAWPFLTAQLQQFLILKAWDEALSQQQEA